MEKVKRFKKRIVSLFMALIMFFGCFGYALGQSDTANAATSSPMRVSSNGNIVWGTTSHLEYGAAKCDRVLFIVDGNIKGEYTGLKEITDEKERERYLLIY